MYKNECFLPFFRNVETTRAVLTVIVMVDRGEKEDETISYAASKYGINSEDIAHYWNIVKRQERWIQTNLQPH
jgi:hypothetical protein